VEPGCGSGGRGRSKTSSAWTATRSIAAKLEIDRQRFVVHDLAAPFNLGRGFDLCQSLEVAEHLPPARAKTFVADLAAQAPVVLSSAATPGQGGENHLNEQPGSYWQSHFLDHDYVAIDCLRPLLVNEARVPAWYRYNLVLYARRASSQRIAPFAREFQLRDGELLSDPSPLPYRLRKRIIRSLPKVVCDRLAQWNARRFPSGRSFTLQHFGRHFCVFLGCAKR
jgi:hypothetical protein